MEDKTNLIEPLFEKAEAYGKTSYELFKLKALDKAAAVISTFVSRGIVILFISIFIIIGNIGISFWLGDLLGKQHYGFFCVALFYGVIGGILYFFMHNRIKQSVSNSVITQMLN